MGTNNRARRAAKARNRVGARAGRPNTAAGPSPDDHAIRAGAASVALRALVLFRAQHPGAPLDRDLGRRHGAAYLSMDVEHQQLAVDDQLTAMTRSAIAGGWTPLDLYEVARRRCPADVVAHLLANAAVETSRHSPVHPDWSDQLEQLGAVAVPGGCAAWARLHELPWDEAHASLIELLVLLASVPRLECVIPPPGAAIASGKAEHVNAEVLRKVRALLVKAESTQFEPEAEALTAKAQQLMTTHSIERTLAETAEPMQARPTVRRIWLDAPYVQSKSMLVDAVAASNHCRCVFTARWDFVTLIGHATDLELVEVLSTSLLVQAIRAMTAMGSRTSRNGTSRTRAFRNSFLTGFAMRIGERLRVAATDTEAHADAVHGGSLLPVLASRDAAVDGVARELFPQLVTRRVSVSDGAGWGAGRAAADLAQLDVRHAVRS